MTEDKHDNGSLPDLPDLPELVELEELEELPELPELTELEPIVEAPKPKPAPVVKKPTPVVAKPAPQPESKPEPVVAAPLASISPLDEEPSPAPDPVAASKPLKPGEKPPLRVLEKAVVHLRLAAMVVAGGSLLPFMLANPAPEGGYTEGSMWFSFAAKLLGAVGAWLLYQQVLHNWGPPLPGVLGKLASLNLIPKPKAEDKPKRKAKSKRNPEVATLEHPFPTLIHLLCAGVILGACILAIKDPRSGKAGPVGLVEYAMFTWAALTYVHIAGYERWGKFNPLYAMLFLGMLLVGVSSIFAGLSNEGPLMISGILGGLLVGGGGGMAAFTIVEAMMQAKKEGDLKKAAAIEARKAARKSSRK